MGPDPAAFAATLTAVVLAHPWLGVISIGDGFVIARAEDEAGVPKSLSNKFRELIRNFVILAYAIFLYSSSVTFNVSQFSFLNFWNQAIRLC